MFVHRMSTKIAVKIAAALALAGWTLLSGTPAVANHGELPAAYFSLASYEPDAGFVAAQQARALVAADLESSGLLGRERNRARKFKVINYKRELKLRNEAVVVRMKSPGKRNSIVSVELRF